MTEMATETYTGTETIFMVMINDRKTYEDCMEVCRKHEGNMTDFIANLQTIARLNPEIKKFHKREMRNTNWVALAKMWLAKQKEIDNYDGLSQIAKSTIC